MYSLHPHTYHLRFGEAMLKPPLLRMHTLPPSIGTHKKSQTSLVWIAGSPLGSYHAAHRGSLIRPLDVEVRKETTFHNRRLHPGRRGCIDTWGHQSLWASLYLSKLRYGHYGTLHMTLERTLA